MGWQDAPIISKSRWQDAPLVDNLSQPEPVQPDVSNSAVIGESLSREAPSGILGAPMDIVNLLANTVKSGAQVLSGRGSEPYESIPAVGGSEFFKEKVFNEVADREDYTGKQNLLGNVTSFGAEALGGGAGLAAKASSARKAPGVISEMLEPYAQRPISQVATDVASGAGAGGGLTVAEENDMGPIGSLFSMLMGGAGGTGVAKSLENTGRGINAMTKTTLPDGSKARKGAVNDASLISDELVTNKESAIQNIDQSLIDADELGISAPTTGPASGDIGLSMLEVKDRLKNPQKFVEKDQNIRTDIAGKFAEYQNPDADVTAPQRASSNVIDREINTRQADIDDLSSQQDVSEQGLTDLQRVGEDISAPIKSRHGDEGRASAQIDEQVKEVLDDKTKAKNKLFEESAEGAFVDAKTLLETVNNINASQSKLSLKDNTISNDLVTKIRSFIPEKGTVEGPDSTAGMIPAKEVLELRRELSTKISESKASGDFTAADTYSDLKKAINDTINNDPVFENANANYKGEYAPFFAEGYGKKYRDTTQRGDGTGTSDPENIGKFFLNRTSSAKDDLDKIKTQSNNQADFDRAEELYFDAMLAKKDINPKVVRNFIADNKDILPDNLKTKYDGVVKDLMDNRVDQDSAVQGIKDLKKQIRSSEQELSSTTRSLESGPFGKMSGQDQDKYIGSIFGGKDRNKQIDNVLKEFDGDQDATDGFKEATVRWLQKKVKGTDASATDLPETDEVGRPVVYSKLTKTFDDNREALAKVFTSDEMNDLNRIHALMSRQNNLSRRATTGSDTVEKLRNADEQLINVFEAALKLKYGMLKGSGIVATARKAKRALLGETGRIVRAEDVLTKMAFDPKVAKHILGIKPLTVNNGKWLTDMNKLIISQEIISDQTETDE